MNSSISEAIGSPCVKMALLSWSYSWVALAVAAAVTTFSPVSLLWLLLCFLSFVVGALSMLYQHGRAKGKTWWAESGTMRVSFPPIGLPSLVEDLWKGRKKLKADRRMTGSSIIDEVLQEVLDYTYRDYIHCWYRRISDDEQFRYDMRMTLQRVIIALSERAKDVDLVPYLTTHLVDDFASHIKLYRRALERVKAHQKDDTKPPPDLEAIFFDLEMEMEKNLCRDAICLSDDSERQYLQDLSESLLFLLLPPEDFHSKPFRQIVREVLVNGIFLPTFNMISDPDYINQSLCTLCGEAPLTNDCFLLVLKTTDSVAELEAVKEKVDLDIARQRSKDSGGEDDVAVKRQLSSLLYVNGVCEKRIEQLHAGLDEPDLLPMGMDMTKLMVPGQRLYNLPFDVVLHNNIALSYFLEFMTSIGAQGCLFFYLTVEARLPWEDMVKLNKGSIFIITETPFAIQSQGYRVSTEQQMSAVLLTEDGSTGHSELPDLEMVRDAAISIYNQYLSDKVSPRLCIDDAKVKVLKDRIYYDQPVETIFDEVQARIWDILREDPRYFPAFRKSQLYIKLLAELDLLKDGATRLDDCASDNGNDSDTSKSSEHRPSAEDLLSSGDSTSSNEPPTKCAEYTLTARISTTGTCHEHGKVYAVYLITVKKMFGDGTHDTWDIYRRYSDFYDIHTTILEKYDSLAGLALPGKKTFNNMNKEFLERRRAGLNAYLQALLSSNVLNAHCGLLSLVAQFLERITWEKEKTQIAKKIVNPFKASVRNVGSLMKAMPDNFADGVARVSGGLRNIPNNMLDGVGRILHVKAPPPSRDMKGDLRQSGKVGACLGAEGVEENIPLRIVLLLMDEVFDLKSKGQWLNRRIVAILRQIVKTVFGDSFNRKIVDHVEWMTSAEQIVEYIRRFRDVFWPNGTLAETPTPRDENTKLRTRVACKAKMLSNVSDELRTLIGSETTRQGVTRVFTMVQQQRLNKRLLYVILEGILETLFPHNKFPDMFHKMHSQSERARQAGGATDTKGAASRKHRK